MKNRFLIIVLLVVNLLVTIYLLVFQLNDSKSPMNKEVKLVEFVGFNTQQEKSFLSERSQHLLEAFQFAQNIDSLRAKFYGTLIDADNYELEKQKLLQAISEAESFHFDYFLSLLTLCESKEQEDRLIEFIVNFRKQHPPIKNHPRH